jgi:hypothetical protein
MPTLKPFNAGAYNTQTSGIAVPTGTYDASDLLRRPEVDEDFHSINDGSFMLYMLLAMFAKGSPSTQPRYEFFIDDILPVRTTFVGAYASDDTTALVLTDGIASLNTNLFVPRTEEVIRVTTISGSTLSTVTRGHRGTTAAAILAGDDVFLIGQDLPEGADANLGVSQIPEKDWNAISFYSTGWKTTDVQDISDMLNNVGQNNREMRMQMLKMMREVDGDLRWGKRNIDTTTSANGNLYYTDGFNSRVSTHEIELSGELDWYALNDALLPVFNNTSSSLNKQWLMGQSLYSDVNRVARDHVVETKFNKQLGSNVQKLVLEGGYIIDLIIDRHGFPPNTEVSNWGFLIDAAQAEFIPYEGFDMNIREVTDPKSHTPQFELFNSASMKLVHEDNNAVVKRV